MALGLKWIYNDSSTISLQYQLLFNCLEHILARIADDLAQYQLCGNAIVQHILERNTGAVYYQLAMRNKSSQIKSGLKLLTAMVMLNADSARDVLLQLQFSNSLSDMYALMYRRDIKVWQKSPSNLLINLCEIDTCEIRQQKLYFGTSKKAFFFFRIVFSNNSLLCWKI